MVRRREDSAKTRALTGTGTRAGAFAMQSQDGRPCCEEVGSQPPGRCSAPVNLDSDAGLSSPPYTGVGGLRRASKCRVFKFSDTTGSVDSLSGNRARILRHSLPPPASAACGAFRHTGMTGSCHIRGPGNMPHVRGIRFWTQNRAVAFALHRCCHRSTVLPALLAQAVSKLSFRITPDGEAAVVLKVHAAAVGARDHVHARQQARQRLQPGRPHLRRGCGAAQEACVALRHAARQPQAGPRQPGRCVQVLHRNGVGLRISRHSCALPCIRCSESLYTNRCPGWSPPAPPARPDPALRWSWPACIWHLNLSCTCIAMEWACAVLAPR